MKWRTVRAYLKEQKEKDPGCELSEHALRRMIAEDKVPHINTGVKILFDADYLEDMFNTPVNGLSKISGSGSMVAIEK